MEGNPRIIRDLGVESWDEPPLDISAASNSAPKTASKTASSVVGKKINFKI